MPEKSASSAAPGHKTPDKPSGKAPKNGAKSPAGLQEKLRALGLLRREDFLFHFPLRYEDETCLTPICEALGKAAAQVEGEVTDCQVLFRPRRQLVAQITDPSGTLVLRFLNFYPNQQAALAIGNRVRCLGEIRQGFYGAEMVHPRFRVVYPDTPLPQTLTPVYPTTAGLAQSVLGKRIATALSGEPLSETLPDALLQRLFLPPLWEAVCTLHRPPAGTDPELLGSRQHPAWRRVKLDELLAQQISLRQSRRQRRVVGAPILPGTGSLAQKLVAALPFSLTPAQERVVKEIGADLACPYPMQRLLQGDVGAGKTLVAALAACQTIESGWQAAFMAPTEILAEQHYAKFQSWLEPLGIRTAFLTGSQKEKERRKELEAARDSSLVTGTHALIQTGVNFDRLGLVVIDEQHRFGVRQRLALRQKGASPHQLMMSATPIPRSLAMSYYADLDVSVLDELPPGRLPVRTRLLRDDRREEVMDYVRRKTGEGRQVYWVCPLIEESEALQLQAAEETWGWLKDALPQRVVGLIHGRLKAAEKQAVMGAFLEGGIHLLVATTVIEVGVDIPNASIMVIEHAERFGLSQLHQLRGRVGRGEHESSCILLYAEPLSFTAKMRLKIIFEHHDGFEIARRDLALRGPGEFIGNRQSGLPLLRYADLEQDLDLVEIAKSQAETLMDEAPGVAALYRERWLYGKEELLKA